MCLQKSSCRWFRFLNFGTTQDESESVYLPFGRGFFGAISDGVWKAFRGFWADFDGFQGGGERLSHVRHIGAARSTQEQNLPKELAGWGIRMGWSE
jgi:hypothetical protein